MQTGGLLVSSKLCPEPDLEILGLAHGMLSLGDPPLLSSRL